ncbi:MAG: CvpA family protein [Campylobacterota bacterium]
MIDIVVGGLVVVLGLKGILNGMVKEVFGLLAIAGGIFIASSFSAGFGSFVDQNIYSFQKPEIATLVGFVLLLIIAWGGILLLGGTISKLVKLSGLGIIDKILGVVFASGKIFVIFAVIAYAISSVDILSKQLQPQTEKSFLFPLLEKTGGFIVNIDPELFEKAKEKAGQSIDFDDFNMSKIENKDAVIEQLKQRAQEGDAKAKELMQKVEDAK